MPDLLPASEWRHIKVRTNKMGWNRIVVGCAAGTFAAAIVLYWLMQPPVLFQYQLSEKHRLTIRQKSSSTPNRVSLYITYHNPPALGPFSFGEQEIVRPHTSLTFGVLSDPQSELVCVFDNNECGFLLIYDVVNEDLWDSTGRSGGWNGTDKEFWQTRLNDMKAKHAAIPYSRLPTGN